MSEWMKLYVPWKLIWPQVLSEFFIIFVETFIVYFQARDEMPTRSFSQPVWYVQKTFVNVFLLS